jgi:hypothetical protein
LPRAAATTRRAAISGDTVIAKVSGEVIAISGETVIAKISGETVVAEVSGQAIRVSGETIIAKVSGEVVDIKVPTEIKTGSTRTLSDASGGEVLHSGAVVSVTVKALSANSGDIYVGGENNRPYSGFGFLLEAGEAINVDVSDFSDVYLVATVSGDKVTFLGIA